MHDIICPDCGDRFLASDVAFDLSKYITPLLHESPEDEEDVLSVKFKFYADEDSILRSTEPGNDIPLAWETPIGPSSLDPLYPYVVTADTIFQYICDKIGQKPIDLEYFLDSIEEANANNTSGRFTCTAQQLKTIRELYYAFFDVAKQSVGSFDLSDNNVNIAIKILLHINSTRRSGEKITLRLRCYSEERNGYHVPDIIFIQDGLGRPTPIKKCCRSCGTVFPTEFGYYKMMPVILLGSHFAGKTSFLLAMYHTATNYEPFTLEGPLNTDSLKNDPNLEAFDKNIRRFEQGQPPVKTDFVDVPILNLRVNDVIYSFIDWPGEKFIDDTASNNDDFILDQRRVLAYARHILFFIEPSQVDETLKSGEEHVKFAAPKIANNLSRHLTYLANNGEKLRSMIYIVNKADMLSQNENTAGIYEQFRGKPEIDFYNNGQWQNSQFEALEHVIKDGYLATQNPSLMTGLSKVVTNKNVVKMFMPVAPYGSSDNVSNGVVVHRGCLSGLPLIKILQVDAPLIKKKTK